MSWVGRPLGGRLAAGGGLYELGSSHIRLLWRGWGTHESERGVGDPAVNLLYTECSYGVAFTGAWTGGRGRKAPVSSLCDGSSRWW